MIIDVVCYDETIRKDKLIAELGQHIVTQFRYLLTFKGLKTLEHLHSKLIHSLLVLIFLLIGSLQVNATHNRAGEITYEQIGELTIRAKITTFTRTSSFGADRDSLEISWGDGQIEWLQRVNGDGEELPNDIKRNEYVGEHTYPTRGSFKLSTTDPNRIGGILNIDFPNSVNIQFYLETTFTLLDPRFQGVNNSAELLQPPIDFACVGQVFVHNPNAYDRDGDSLSYQLITPFQEEGLEVPNYQLPDLIGAGPDNKVTLDPLTGDFRWDAPPVQGEFNITYRINEYRNGVLINSIIRDMQVLVRACPDMNNPPSLESIEEICVVAGEKISIDILGRDIDSMEILTITALGGPFELDESPAIFSVIPPIANSQARATFEWQTICDHVAEEYYQIVVKVTDELTRPMSALATLKTIRIKVTGPAPTGPAAIKENDLVTITWDNPYACGQSNTFQGFSVWRREGGEDVVLDTCRGGLEGTGYEKVVFLTDEEELGRYIAQDAELERGKIFCYRVVAEFALLTASGSLFNRTASLPSEEVCVRTSGEEPLITNVTVDITDQNTGQITVIWLPPVVELIDTTELVGPYNINAYESMDEAGAAFMATPFATFEATSISALDDTIAMRQDLNTSESPYSYRLDFVSGVGAAAFIAPSSVASSVYLNTAGTDEAVNLSWSENVPWNNFNYNIYQLSPNGDLQFIDSTTDQSYKITGLVNGEESCFVIESEGRYRLAGVKEPLINYSNRSCATPRDNQAPCSPIIDISSVCDQEVISSDRLINTVIWSTCDEDDLEGYRIYFKPNVDDEVTLLAEVGEAALSYEHVLSDNIAGCYVVRSYDSSGNESDIIDEMCIDNCPNYVLPNAFTPNSDQSNDLFTPRVNLFIDRVVFEVFNRWGQKVWETNDPELNWDGTNFANKELSEGTYYYKCQVFEKRVSGIELNAEVLRGSLQLLR